MKIVFRTDASNLVGTGHIMRCLTLAEALHKRKVQCQFICREHAGNLLGLIRQRGFETIVLPKRENIAQDDKIVPHSHWLGVSWQEDAAQTQAAISGSVDWLIVDHYAVDARWEKALRPYCKRLMVIDDLADRLHDCDLLLDQNLVADMQRRYDSKVPEDCIRLLGPEYALLQEQYKQLHPRIPPREGDIHRILIYFGGADVDNLTGRTVAAILALRQPELVVDVIMNAGHPYAQEIRQQIASSPQIFLHESLPSLAILMAKADLAIGASGTTTWERCCLGLPSLVITLADNQKSIAMEMHSQGCLYYLGDKAQVAQTTLVSALQKILENGVSANMSKRCRALVDGQGTQRVVAHLLLEADTPLVARPARIEDEQLILSWANDLLVRKNSFSQAPIESTTHHVWFSRCLRNVDSCRLYIVETAQDGLAIGQVRFEQEAAGWKIDYALAPNARGRHLGKAMLQTAILALRQNIETCLVFAEVKAANTASRRVFEELGFDYEISEGGGGEGGVYLSRFVRMQGVGSMRHYLNWYWSGCMRGIRSFGRMMPKICQAEICVFS